jgi:hypothetical protein
MIRPSMLSRQSLAACEVSQREGRNLQGNSLASRTREGADVGTCNLTRQRCVMLGLSGSNQSAISAASSRAPSALKSSRAARLRRNIHNTASRTRRAREACEACTISASHTVKRKWSVASAAPSGTSSSTSGPIRQLTATGRNSSYRAGTAACFTFRKGLPTASKRSAMMSKSITSSPRHMNRNRPGVSGMTIRRLQLLGPHLSLKYQRRIYIGLILQRRRFEPIASDIRRASLFQFCFPNEHCAY